MAVLTWDAATTRHYETGVSKGVLFVMDSNGSYGSGVAWNGLVSVSESPSGAEATPIYADNTKYLNLISAEEFGFTIEAFMYPNEFGACDGSLDLVASKGVKINQQARSQFGLAYRTEIGNDVSDTHGYKLHLVYGCLAAPSEKAYQTINDSPEAITFSWEVTTTPVAVSGFRPTSLLVIDSTVATASDLTEIENLIYGTAGTAASLPSPSSVITLISS